MQILRIDSAVTGYRSISRQLTQAITDHLQAASPQARLVTRDLAADPLPHIDEVTTAAIRTPPANQSGAVAAAYPAEHAVLDEFLASDVVVIGAPMYNFSIPSQLKAWLDRLAVPGVTFRYSEKGPEGLAGGRKVVIASSRGGEYENGTMVENQESLLLTMLGFLGVEGVQIIRVDRVGHGPDAIAAGMAAAMDQIAKL